MDTIYIYTDGSSDNKTKDGGWAFCTTDNPKGRKELTAEAGYAPNTTNNRMELSAAMYALECAAALNHGVRKIVLYTDSKYVSDSIYYGWLNDWRANGWEKPVWGKPNKMEPTKNADLWEEMWQLLNRFKFRKIQVEICWVKGHNGNYYNELCDRLCGAARKDRKINPLYETV